MFLGTPNHGVEGIDLASLLLRIQSIYSPTNATVLRNLQKDSEYLRSQLSLYGPISGKFHTKYFYEVYRTRILGGARIMASCRILPRDPSPSI